MVYCPADQPGACFEAAQTACGGAWRAAAEPDMPTPAMIGEENGRYRMLVACGEDAK
jgi:hypothetical protein